MGYGLGHSGVELCTQISRRLIDFQEITNFHCLLNEGQVQYFHALDNLIKARSLKALSRSAVMPDFEHKSQKIYF